MELRPSWVPCGTWNDGRADALAGRRGSLRIGTTPTLGADLMPLALGLYRSAHPSVHFEVTSSGDSDRLAIDVREGRLDVALAVVSAPLDPLLEISAEGPQPFVLVVPSGHRLAGYDAVPLAELAAERLVTLRASEGLRLLVDRIFVDLGAEPDVAIETTDRDMLVPLVAAGLGVTLLPDHFARRREVEGVVLRSDRTACDASGRGDRSGGRRLLGARGLRGRAPRCLARRLRWARVSATGHRPVR